jgi:hypothetical protein
MSTNTQTNTCLIICSVLLIVGLTFSLIGGATVINNSPLAEDEAIQDAALVSPGPNGERTYTSTNGTVAQALHHMAEVNKKRELERRIGKSLAVPGIALLGIAAILFAYSKFPQKRPDPVV